MSDKIKVGINTFFIKDGKILLGKRLSKVGYGTWGLPGGHLEPGEGLIDGAKREVLEETGIEATELEFLQLINDPRQNEHYIQINFLAKKWIGEPAVREPDKCERWEWFKLEEMPEDIFFGHKQFIPAYKQGVKFIS
ncbi:MAG: NUDIX domain-containing protein [Patescibacteria group bacterium]|nr:NUDIX domain-containing protein [Patescibacteria group bacterium]